jgi:hypothetical protein
MNIKEYIQKNARVTIQFRDPTDEIGKIKELERDQILYEPGYPDDLTEDNDRVDQELRGSDELDKLNEYSLLESGMSIVSSHSDQGMDDYDQDDYAEYSRWGRTYFDWLMDAIEAKSDTAYDPTLLLIAAYLNENAATFNDIVGYVLSYIPCENLKNLHSYACDADTPTKARFAVIYLMIWCQSEQSEQALFALLEDKDGGIRETALEVLHSYNSTPQLLNRLLQLIREERDEMVAHRVLFLLETMIHDENRNMIEQTIKNSWWQELYEERKSWK